MTALYVINFNRIFKSVYISLVLNILSESPSQLFHCLTFPLEYVVILKSQHMLFCIPMLEL